MLFKGSFKALLRLYLSSSGLAESTDAYTLEQAQQKTAKMSPGMLFECIYIFTYIHIYIYIYMYVYYYVYITISVVV